MLENDCTQKLLKQALNGSVVHMIPTPESTKLNKRCEFEQLKYQKMCTACDIIPTTGGTLRSIIRKEISCS